MQMRQLEGLSLRALLFGTFLLALLLRLAFLSIKPLAWSHQLQAGDEPLYHGLAINLMRGEGYVFEGEPRSYPPPLHPLFIAAVYRVVGISPPAVRVMQAVLGSLLCMLIAWWAAAIWGKRAGLFAGVVAALYYPFLQLPLYLMTENLYLPLFMAAAMMTWRLGDWTNRRNELGSPLRRQSGAHLWVKALLAGVLWGLAVLTREIARGAFFLALLWAIVRTRWQKTFLLFVATLVVTLPWSIRNRAVFRAPSQSSAQIVQVPKQPLWMRLLPGGLLYMSFGPPGTEPRILGHWNWGSDVRRPEEPPNLPQTERDRWLKEQALAYIRANPTEAIVQRIPRKLANLLTPFYGTASLPNKVLTTFCYLLLLALSLPAWWQAWRSQDLAERRLAELVLLIATFTFVFHTVFYGVVRYRYPIDALLLVFSGKSLKDLAGRLFVCG